MNLDPALLMALCASSFVLYLICAFLRTKNTATMTTFVLCAAFLSGGSVQDLEYCTVVLALCLVVIAGGEKLIKAASDT